MITIRLLIINKSHNNSILRSRTIKDIASCLAREMNKKISHVYLFYKCEKKKQFIRSAFILKKNNTNRHHSIILKICVSQEYFTK